MDKNPPEISIIISTHNRSQSLLQTLKSIGQLEYPQDRFEVIVVDDGSVDDTREVLTRFSRRAPFSFKYRSKKDEGVSSARNMGIGMARGEVLVFIDDDCAATNSWLKNLTAQINSDEVGVIGGPEKIPPEGPLLSRCVGYIVNSFVGAAGLFKGEGPRLGRFYPKGCNMALTKRVLHEVGLFDENLMPSEDVELAYRIRRAGYKIKYAPRAAVIHHRNISFKNFLSKTFWIGYFRAILGFKHRGFLQVAHLIPAACFISFLILAVGWLFLSWPPLLFVLPVAAYILTVVGSGVHAALSLKDARALVLIPLLLPLHHLSHALGFLAGGFRYVFGLER
jgi:GT2 family glycosyltransferase